MAAASSLSSFSSLSLHPSSRRFSLHSPLPTTSLSYSPLSLSTTKFNCTPSDEITPTSKISETLDKIANNEDPSPSEIEIPDIKKEVTPVKYYDPNVELDPFTSTKDEIAAAYERLYGPAYSGVSYFDDDVNVMDKNIIEGPAKKVRDDFDEQVVQIKRVTKVVKGGKQMNFRTVVVVGNFQGKVGVGVGKASEIATAVAKGVYDARRNIIDVPMTKHMTFPHRANGKYGAAEVMLRPACPGTGVIAGGAVRTVLELAGLENALGKQLRSNNTLNNARATCYAIMKMRQFSDVAADRGIPMEELWK